MRTQFDCAVCGNAKNVPLTRGLMHIGCARCGNYTVTRSAAAELYNKGLPDLVRVWGWIRRANSEGSTPRIDTFDLPSIIALPIPPVYDRAILFLQELARSPGHLGQGHIRNHERFIGVTYSAGWEDANFLLTLLVEEGFVRVVDSRLQVLPQGYIKLDELKRPGVNPVGFIAMYFGDSMKPYHAAASTAVSLAGYRPLRVDDVEHVGKIDDQIIASINEARFVVADFTAQRGGVYFEAGYAMGRGLPVFWTCHEDEIDKIHFDNRQYNFILWNPSAVHELTPKLMNRIRAVLGQGPLPAAEI